MTGELGDIRKDYVLEKYVLVSSVEKNSNSSGASKCPCCPGNESMTSPAVLALVVNDGLLQRLSDSEDNVVEDWSVRVFESSDPLVATNTASTFGEKPLYSEPAYGYHHIVVASPDHKQKLSEMSLEQLANVLVVVQDRVRHLYTQKSVTYVSVYINSGQGAGAAFSHSHLNVVTFSTIPPIIEAEAEAYHRFMNENGNCPACSMIHVESKGPREVLNTESFVSLCPWAPAYPYEFWIYPKKHLTSFAKITQKEIGDLALILRATLGGMAKALNNADYNLVFHLSPEKKNSRQIHWHIEVYPQIGTWSGLERGFGVFVSKVLPEKSAEVLGSAARKELASLFDIS